jgi:hypothetical protein
VTDSEAVVRETLAAAVRRVQVRHALHGLAGGAVAAAILSGLVISRGGGVGAAGAVGGIAAVLVLVGYFWRTHGRRVPARVAIEIEGRQPELRNLLITAEELLRTPHRTRAWIRHRVFDDAARALSHGARTPERRLTGSLTAAVTAVVIWVAALGGVHRPAVESIRERAAVALMPLSGQVTVRATVTPPLYTGADAPRTLTNPERIELLEGSRLQLVVSGAGDRVRIRLGTSELPATREGGRSTIETVVTASGYVAIEPEAGSSATGRLIAVAVTADRLPSVKVDAPGRDLLLADASQRIPIRASAADDLGLRALELRYTKVSGTGEQFEFVEGSIPMTVSRGSETEWAGASEIALGALGLETGDSLVYRVVARDGRPGSDGLGSSDTYIVEIAGPGQLALAGTDMPPDQDRYALSQQMIVLKIERLRSRENGMARDALQEQFENLAAEQRAVRANFIYLMGGHVEDEEEEAEQSHEIQEGRLENRARRDISAAVRHMTIAERGLAAFSTPASLPPARAAVEALQRAFGRSRYILRAMPVRSRIDRSRRLSGELRGASGWLRDADPGRDRSVPSRARALLGRLRELTSAGGQADRAALVQLAEEAIAVTPGSVEWQEVAARLTRGETAAAAALLHDQAQRDVLPQSDRMTRPSRLRSAFVESRR